MRPYNINANLFFYIQRAFFFSSLCWQPLCIGNKTNTNKIARAESLVQVCLNEGITHTCSHSHDCFFISLTLLFLIGSTPPHFHTVNTSTVAIIELLPLVLTLPPKVYEYLITPCAVIAGTGQPKLIIAISAVHTHSGSTTTHHA